MGPRGSITVLTYFLSFLFSPSSRHLPPYRGLISAPVFAGRDPSRALATSSLKKEDCIPEWQDLEEKEKTVLEEWFTFFSKRYDIVGKVVRGAGIVEAGEEGGVRS